MGQAAVVTDGKEWDWEGGGRNEIKKDVEYIDASKNYQLSFLSLSKIMKSKQGTCPCFFH